jgi:hypothetical protein
MRFSTGWASALWVLATLGLPATQATAVPAAGAPSLLQAGNVSDAARQLAQRVLALRDNAGRPFAIVDKQAAMLMVYRADGQLAGVTPALLGQAVGDASVSGVGERSQAGRLRRVDQTTAAGRFASEPGRNRAGESVVWIDYANALAIHRLRPGPALARRTQGLASSNAQDRRLSAGCVVVAVAFYEAVVQPLLGAQRGVVYVMPETGPAGMNAPLFAGHLQANAQDPLNSP